MSFFKIKSTEVTLLDSLSRPSSKESSDKTRLLIPCQLGGINFIIRLQERPVFLVVYASLRNKLHIITEMHVKVSNDRVLGGLYDANAKRLIICLEAYKTQAFDVIF